MAMESCRLLLLLCWLAAATALPQELRTVQEQDKQADASTASDAAANTSATQGETSSLVAEKDKKKDDAKDKAEDKSHISDKKDTVVLFTFHQYSDLEEAQIKNLKDGMATGHYDVVLMHDDTLAVKSEDKLEQFGLPIVSASREDLQRHYGKTVYDEFSGIYKAPVKPGSIKWITENNYQYIWILESDVVFTGSWGNFIGGHGSDQSDFIAVYIGVQGEQAWPSQWFWKNCTICDETNHMGAFLPAQRLSSRFANDVHQLLTSGHTGHHEAFLPTACKMVGTDHCQYKNIDEKWVGKILFRPSLVEKQITDRDKLYHPVKEIKQINVGQQLVVFDTAKLAAMSGAVVSGQQLVANGTSY